MFRSVFRPVALVALLTVMPACSDDQPTTPTTPTNPPVTETFSGSINPNGGATHTFTGSTAGNVTATLSAVGPDSAAIVGFLLGVWNGSSCTTVTASDAASQNTVLYGNLSASAVLCVRVYDVGRLTEGATYEITVVHP
ncbi:MAG: hypothetical protein AB7Q16_15240 [Vicinamibacterales bacterium]